MKLKKKLAYFYMFWSTFANVFRFHELRFLKKHLKTKDEDLVLDIACGIGMYTNLIGRNVYKAFGIDLSEHCILMANHFRLDNTFFQVANAQEIPFENETFDSIFSICALEHFNDHKAGVQEMFRLLKPGGQLLITVDSLANINSEKFIAFHKEFCVVVNYFNQESISSLLEEHGFCVKVCTNIMRSRFSAFIAVLAFKILKFPKLFNLFSIVTYPMTCLADFLATSAADKGVIIAIYAEKPSMD